MKHNRVMLALIGFLLVGVLGFAGYQQFIASAAIEQTPEPMEQPVEEVISAQGFIVPRRASDLAFRTGGRVIEVLVSEGEAVKQGQPLVRLQSDELSAAVAQAQAALDLSEANAALVEQGARPEEIAIAEASLRAAQAQMGVAVAERDRLTGGVTDAVIAASQAQLASALVEQKLAQDAYDKITSLDLSGTLEEQARYRLNAANEAVTAAQKALDEATSGSTLQAQAAQSNVTAALAQRDLAQAQLDLLKNGTRQSQIDAAQATVAQAEAALNAARAVLAEATLKAPFDGVVALITAEVGQVISPGFVVASMANVETWEVETDDLSETDVVRVQPGQPVSIAVDALPNVTLNGTVAAITPRAENKRGDVTYTVKIAIENPDPRLRWGMTAQVEVRIR